MLKSDWAAYNPVKIHAGAGILKKLPEFIGNADGNLLLVTTAGFVRRGVAQQVIELLGNDRTRIYDAVTPNPELDDLDHAAGLFSNEAFSTIVALGGGSAIDAAKALSVALPAGFSNSLPKVLRENNGHQWAHNIPVIAIPTTSGTGAEVTPFATVWDGVQHKKYSVVGPRVYPQIALLDPTLTLSLPAQETLYTALDAISHALESLWNKNRTPISEAYSTQALRLAIQALPAVLSSPGDLDARTRMQQASALAGLAISQTRTAIAHSISYPLTSHFDVPHGLACSFSLENIIALYLEQHPDVHFKALMLDTKELLARLRLFDHLAKYADKNQIAAVKGEMFLPGRADNFDGAITELDSLINAR